jgi:hypothetical protein
MSGLKTNFNLIVVRPGLTLLRSLRVILFATAFAPAAILLHECGHFIVAKAFGLGPQLHFGFTTLDRTSGPIALSAITAGGPCVTALMVTGGLVWLWRSRREHPLEPVTYAGWCATLLVFCSARWLRFSTGALAMALPNDEAVISASIGFPKWALPYALVSLAFCAVLAATCLHPRSRRLAPLSSAMFGLCLGAVLWLKLAGPRLLP